jgi:hypothetical protein
VDGVDLLRRKVLLAGANKPNEQDAKSSLDSTKSLLS